MLCAVLAFDTSSTAQAKKSIFDSGLMIAMRADHENSPIVAWLTILKVITLSNIVNNFVWAGVTSKKGIKLVDEKPRIGAGVNKMALLHPKALGAS